MFSSITQRSWEMGIARCRKVMQWNSKLYKDQKGHKQQTYKKQQLNRKRNHGAGGSLICRPFHCTGDPGRFRASRKHRASVSECPSRQDEKKERFLVLDRNLRHARQEAASVMATEQKPQLGVEGGVVATNQRFAQEPSRL